MQNLSKDNQRNCAPIYLASSPGFILLASVCYISALVALILIAWPWWLRFLILVLLIYDYRHNIRQYGLRANKSSIAILLPDCNKWQYQLRSGKRYKGRLIKQRSFCCPLVLIMYIRSITDGRYVLIPRDALSTHNYRFLAFKINH